MRCAVVSASFLFRLGNWSPDFVLPYAQFMQALKDRDIQSRGVSLERLVANLSRFHQARLETLVNDVADREVIDLEDLAARVREILLHHTKSNLFEKGELELFRQFVADWCSLRWKTKADAARALADEYSAKEAEVKGKIKQAIRNHEILQSERASGGALHPTD